MMNSELAGVIAQVVLAIVLSYPLGRYIAGVYQGKKSWLSFLAPVERLIYRLCGIDPAEQMDWKSFLKALLVLNGFWLVWGITWLLLQGWLPLNPDGNASQPFSLAFHTAVSFLVNANQQHYSGEWGMTYFTQLFVVMLFQFLTAATGMAALAGVMKALAAKSTRTIGNFWQLLVVSCTRILLPLSLVVGIILILQGVPMTFDGKVTVNTLEGNHQTVAQGPVAAVVAIKQLGTNGGGFFGANSAHPLENPTYLTNMVECVSILLLPMAMVFAFGFYLNRRKLSYVIFAVMLLPFLVGTVTNITLETGGNPRIEAMGIRQDGGSMEGKEVRFGAAASALWSVATTATSNGSVNSMHDSQLPLSGTVEMLNMQINAWFGGVGAGMLNYYIFIILAVFISGLMVGRTPEFLGKKVEPREMKIATLVVLLHPLVILTGTALAAYLLVRAPGMVAAEGGWLQQTGSHGLSTLLYEFTSSAANNGSGFEGLHDNTSFWNYSTSIVLLLCRYLPLMGAVAIAGLLAQKSHVPDSAGTLKTDTVTFGVMTLAVILLVAALAFFPVHALSSLAEQLSL